MNFTKEHKTEFRKIAVAWLIREGLTQREAHAEVDLVFMYGLENIVNAKADKNNPYVKANRRGQLVALNRKEKIALVTLFQNAAEHATFELTM